MIFIFKHITVCLLSATLLVGCTKGKNQTPEPIKSTNTPVDVEPEQVSEETFEYCTDHSLCKALRDSEKKCRTSHEKKICMKFVETFKKLAATKDCKRKFDTGPVPSVWICDEDDEEVSFPKLFERSASTLAKTKFDFAQNFYGSEAFRSTLDGAVAEEHYKESIRVGNKKE